VSGFFQSPNVIGIQKCHPYTENINSETPGDSKNACLHFRGCRVIADTLSTKICSQHLSATPTSNSSQLKPHKPHHFNTQLWDLCTNSNDSWSILFGLTTASVSHSQYTQVMKRAEEPCDVARTFTPADARMCLPAVTKMAMGQLFI